MAGRGNNDRRGHVGRGVQVVSVSDDHKYQLQEKALESVVLREDTRDCRVALVSVAGAYRGGKSFLLDFFIRYLMSEISSRDEHGSWIGADDEPLIGFSWRGGIERDTTGILLWSEPFHVTLPSGEKICVLLMDTQGTFDTVSTLQDCSTIFALSTLLSSMQIYNLSKDIQEPDLQHLSLFAECGKLATADEGKPFQALKFLVRDWDSYAYKHGHEGGMKLMEKRLEILPGQAEELKEVRQYIKSCFDDISCFLMPHPGFTVTSDPNFIGFVSDIRKEFKDALKELVPLIFEPQNLTLKSINGVPIKARDLIHYFNTYLEEFNSGRNPSPVNIRKATAEAGLLSAEAEARAVYAASMQRACGAGAASVPPHTLRQLHRAALAHALDALALHRIMAPAHAKEALRNRLHQELDAQLAQYQLLNEAKVHRAVADAKNKYEEYVARVSTVENICLHPKDLEKVHKAGLSAALEVFSSNRTTVEGTEDEDKTKLEEFLSDRYKQLRGVNEVNNNAAVTEARDDYLRYMQNACGDQPCLTDHQLQINHEEALERAQQIFMAKRNIYTEYPTDSHMNTLNKDIDEQFSRLLTQNRLNNTTALQAALSAYNTSMGRVCGPDLPCLHPDDLAQEHDDALEIALCEFRSRRTPGQDDNLDQYGTDIEEECERRYSELRVLNEAKNRSAVEECAREYCDSMEGGCRAGLPQLSPAHLAELHERAAARALRAFANRRKDAHHDHHHDSYKNSLEQMIDERFERYDAMNRSLRQQQTQPQQIVIRVEHVNRGGPSTLLGDAVLAGAAGTVQAVEAVASGLGAAAVGAVNAVGEVIDDIRTAEEAAARALIDIIRGGGGSGGNGGNGSSPAGVLCAVTDIGLRTVGTAAQEVVNTVTNAAADATADAVDSVQTTAARAAAAAARGVFQFDSFGLR